MKRTTAKNWISCASVLTLMIIPAVADQATMATSADKHYTGMVISVNPETRLLEVKGFLLSKKFDLGEKCAIEQLDKADSHVSDLQVGEKVKVSYQDASGVLVADRVEQEPLTYAGRVKAIDPSAHTLTLSSGWTEKTFEVPDNCQIKLNGEKSGSLADVQSGSYETVTYELPHGQSVAQQIVQTGTTFTGELTAVDMNDRTVKAKSLFDSKKFHLANDCAIMVNGHPDGHLSDLKLGGQMEFNYEEVNGVYVVNRIANATTFKASHGTETTSVQPVNP